MILNRLLLSRRKSKVYPSFFPVILHLIMLCSGRYSQNVLLCIQIQLAIHSYLEFQMATCPRPIENVHARCPPFSAFTYQNSSIRFRWNHHQKLYWYSWRQKSDYLELVEGYSSCETEGASSGRVRLFSWNSTRDNRDDKDIQLHFYLTRLNARPHTKAPVKNAVSHARHHMHLLKKEKSIR